MNSLIAKRFVGRNTGQRLIKKNKANENKLS